MNNSYVANIGIFLNTPILICLIEVRICFILYEFKIIVEKGDHTLLPKHVLLSFFFKS